MPAAPQSRKQRAASNAAAKARAAVPSGKAMERWMHDIESGKVAPPGRKKAAPRGAGQKPMPWTSKSKRPQMKPY